MKSILLALLVVLALPWWAGAVDRLKIDAARDPNYLPYEAILLTRPRVPAGRVDLPLLVQAAQAIHKGVSLQAAALGINPPAKDGTPAQIVFHSVDNWQVIDPHSVALLLSDFRLTYDSATDAIVAFACGYRHDTAFVCKVYRGDRPPDYQAVATGCDRSRAEWLGIREFLYMADIDGDGHIEGIFHLGSAKNLAAKRLYCIDLVTMATKWTIPFSYYPTVTVAVSGRPGRPPCLLMLAHNSRPEVTAPTYADLYGHLVRISASGEITYNRIIGKTGATLALEYDQRGDRAYFTHSYPPVVTFGEADSTAAGTYLSAYDCTTDRIVSVPMTAAAPDIWLGDYSHRPARDIYTVSDDGFVRIYDSDLNLIAESGQIPSIRSFAGLVAPLDGKDSSMAIVLGDGLALFASDFRLLAIVPGQARIAQTLGLTDGRLASVLVTDFDNYTVALLKKRTAWGYLAVLYLDFRYYIILVLSFLLLSLCITSYYNRNIRNQKLQLESAHRDLTAAHEALKLAQDQLVAQEKQKLAQNIAASFAHEVRNALFPAQMSVFKLTSLDQTALGSERQGKLLSLISQAITRAMSLTDLISQYTKLEAQYQPVTTNLPTVLREALSANVERIETQQVAICMNGPDDAEVAMRSEHLYMILNNLLINALDAVSVRDNPTVAISWAKQAEHVALRFTDNGDGVPEEDRARIFDAFYTTRPNRGTGLGLAIVKKLTGMYNGTVALATQTETGATFELSLRSPQPQASTPTLGAEQ